MFLIALIAMKCIRTRYRPHPVLSVSRSVSDIRFKNSRQKTESSFYEGNKFKLCLTNHLLNVFKRLSALERIMSKPMVQLSFTYFILLNLV